MFDRNVVFRWSLARFFATLALCAGALATCGAQDETPTRTRELFGDVAFERGFKILDVARKPVYRGILNLALDASSDENAKPVWGIACHYSKYDPTKCDVQRVEGRATASTPGQTIELEKDAFGATVLRLRIDSSAEYAAPRAQSTDPWVHLLLQRDFLESERVALKDLDSLTFSCEARVADWKRLGDESSFNPSLHATQASVYFAFPNGDKDSPDYRDFIWFGVSFFDDRSEVQENYAEVDGDPEKIGTGKLIYRLGGQETIDKYMSGVNPYFGEWTKIEIELKGRLTDALAAARKRGMLEHTSVDDLVVAHFNFGWETPGVYRSTLEMKNLRLIATEKGNSTK